MNPLKDYSEFVCAAYYFFLGPLGIYFFYQLSCYFKTIKKQQKPREKVKKFKETKKFQSKG
jgi:hypothetical protein